MHALPAFVCCLATTAAAQVTDFKIYPGLKTQFDQRCTAFASRCSLGAAAGEILQEIPGGGRDTLGNVNDFHRGVGLGANGPGGRITNIYYITQFSGAGQAAYNVRVREVDPLTGRGPDPLLMLLDVPMSLPSGAYGVNLSLTTPLQVPASKSWFVGLALGAATSSAGQSLQMSTYMGSAARANAGRLVWQVDAAGTATRMSASTPIGVPGASGLTSRAVATDSGSSCVTLRASVPASSCSPPTEPRRRCSSPACSMVPC